MKKVIGIAAFAMLLCGCGKSIEDICRESDQLLRLSTGEGFVDAGWIGCLKQSAGEAQKDLNSSRKVLQIEEPKLISHAEMMDFVKSQEPLVVVHKLGQPNAVMFIPFDAEGNPTYKKEKFLHSMTDVIITIEYSNYPTDKPKDRDPDVLKQVLGKLAIRENGRYRFIYDRPLTYGLFGIEDKNMIFMFDIRDQQVINHFLNHPHHLWQNWFN